MVYVGQKVTIHTKMLKIELFFKLKILHIILRTILIGLGFTYLTFILFQV